MTEDAPRITLVARNLADKPMPFGFGLHPYFPSTPQTTLEAHVETVWEVDQEVMPTRRTDSRDLWGSSARLIVREAAVDNAFAGWDGTAEVRWPELGAGVRMTAQTPLRHLVVCAPPGADHFCAEPVSNCTDAFNLAGRTENTGILVLGPAERIATTITLSPFATD